MYTLKDLNPLKEESRIVTMRQTKFIVVTGGVLSGLGKGIAAASIGKLLSSSYNVIPMKLDGYLNVDPGTMNPIEHGEVFVLDDGAETDMDLGHYERFLGVTCKSAWNLTMGKVFDGVRRKERRGDYLGQTVEYIPHVTNYIKEQLLATAKEEEADVLLVEVGGTVGQIENDLYFEAVRQLKKDVGKENILYVHLTYVPIPRHVNEQKTKPTQQSVALLRQRGIQPDIILGRCEEPLDEKVKEKIALFCDVEKEAVITGLDVDSVYMIPFIFEQEGIAKLVSKKFGIPITPKLDEWECILKAKQTKTTTIAICGKYTALEDSYASVIEALKHAALHLNTQLDIRWIETTTIETGTLSVEDSLQGVQGVIVPGGFGSRGIEGKISIIQHCRENNVPYLGLCYGMQLAVIEFARNVCGIKDAHSSEINASTPHPVIDLLPEQKDVVDKGATMRRGGHDIYIKKDTKAFELFGEKTRLRFRHRWEVNPEYVTQLEQGQLVFSGSTKDNRIMQLLELKDHTFFMATQSHPELTSKLEEPNKLFFAFLAAATIRN